MFSHITRERPRVRIVCDRHSEVYIATFIFDTQGRKAHVIIRTVNGVNTQIQLTIREVQNNITSGLWALSYACNEDGSRLEPVTGDEWLAVCNNLREARVAKSQAEAAVIAARAALQAAEAAAVVANTAADTALVAFNNAA